MENELRKVVKLEGNFLKYRKLVDIGSRVKQLKEEKNPKNKKLVCRYVDIFSAASMFCS